MPQELLGWLAQPFTPAMSAARWFLFIGLLLVLLWGWHIVFRELADVEGDLT